MLSEMKKPRRRLQKARRHLQQTRYPTAALFEAFEAYYQIVKIPLVMGMLLASVGR